MRELMFDIGLIVAGFSLLGAFIHAAYQDMLDDGEAWHGTGQRGGDHDARS